jgi:hypothetical protein
MNKPVSEFQATKLRAVLQMAARQLAAQRMKNFSGRSMAISAFLTLSIRPSHFEPDTVIESRPYD